MSQISTGNCSTTNNNTTISFDLMVPTTAGVDEGDIFKIQGENAFYYVAAVNGSPATITLSAPYQGTTGTGKNYIIHRDFTTNLDLPLPYRGDLELTALIRDALLKIDAAIGGGSPE
jgi:hypothetical protein